MYDATEYHREYRRKNRVRLLAERKEYYALNKEKIKERILKYKLENPERVREWNRREYEKHKDRYKALRIIRETKNKEEWLTYLGDVGMTSCCQCGYNKCFASLDFHHINPKDKEFNIGNLLTSKLTEKRKEEVRKCVVLCANCHRELHSRCGVAKGMGVTIRAFGEYARIMRTRDNKVYGYDVPQQTKEERGVVFV